MQSLQKEDTIYADSVGRNRSPPGSWPLVRLSYWRQSMQTNMYKTIKQNKVSDTDIRRRALETCLITIEANNIPMFEGAWVDIQIFDSGHQSIISIRLPTQIWHSPNPCLDSSVRLLSTVLRIGNLCGLCCTHLFSGGCIPLSSPLSFSSVSLRFSPSLISLCLSFFHFLSPSLPFSLLHIFLFVGRLGQHSSGGYCTIIRDHQNCLR